MSLALLPLLLLVAQYQTSVNGRLLTPKDAPALATLDRISEQGKTHHRVQVACRPGSDHMALGSAGPGCASLTRHGAVVRQESTRRC